METQTRERLLTLLNDLPPEKLAAVEYYARFVHEQARNGYAVVVEGKNYSSFMYPTVHLPASTFTKLCNLMPPVGGDALADTESLYDGN